MEIFSTVVTGIAVFVSGQFIVKSLIEPYKELAKIRGEIAYSLIFYANVYLKPGIKDFTVRTLETNEFIARRTKELNEVQLLFRKHASELMARQHSIPLYGIWERVRLVRKKSDILAASRALILISNNMFNAGIGPAEENKETRREIEQKLDLKLGFGA